MGPVVVAGRVREPPRLIFVQKLAGLRASREDQVIFRLIHGLDGEQGNSQAPGLPEKRLQNADFTLVIAIMELDPGLRQIPVFGLGNHMLCQWVSEAV